MHGKHAVGLHEGLYGVEYRFEVTGILDRGNIATHMVQGLEESRPAQTEGIG